MGLPPQPSEGATSIFFFKTLLDHLFSLSLLSSPGSDTSARRRESLNQFQSRVIKTENQSRRINLLIITSKKRQKKSKKKSRSKEYKDKHFVGFLTPKNLANFGRKIFLLKREKKTFSCSLSLYPLSRPGAESDSFRSFKEFDGIIFTGFFFYSSNITSTNNNLLRV